MKQILIEKYIEPSETKVRGNLVIKSWFDRNYDLHSFMGQPAGIFYENGRIIEQQWFKKGVLHRDGVLPACISYYNGQIIRQWWYKKGVRHRDGDLPAYIEYYEYGQINCQFWYKEGILIK
jgi:antitoxin component YwqK of YwqJK toxin-antitoxin module